MKIGRPSTLCGPFRFRELVCGVVLGMVPVVCGVVLGFCEVVAVVSGVVGLFWADVGILAGDVIGEFKLSPIMSGMEVFRSTEGAAVWVDWGAEATEL